MASITTRAGKGSPLTNAEVDANFTNLDAAVDAAALTASWAGVTGKPATLAGFGITDAQAALVSGTNIKTINSSSLVGSGDISLFAGGLVRIERVAALPGTPDPNTLYIVV